MTMGVFDTGLAIQQVTTRVSLLKAWSIAFMKRPFGHEMEASLTISHSSVIH